MSKTVTIQNESGLHARPASAFVHIAAGFVSHITIRDVRRADAANAKSIVTLLSMGLNKGATVEIAAEGEDERQAVEALAALIESGLAE